MGAVIGLLMWPPQQTFVDHRAVGLAPKYPTINGVWGPKSGRDARDVILAWARIRSRPVLCGATS